MPTALHLLKQYRNLVEERGGVDHPSVKKFEEKYSHKHDFVYGLQQLKPRYRAYYRIKDSKKVITPKPKKEVKDVKSENRPRYRRKDNIG